MKHLFVVSALLSGLFLLYSLEVDSFIYKGKYPDITAADIIYPVLEGVPKIIDGDSLHVGGQEVRLQGIDAPEFKQECTVATGSIKCGEKAYRFLLKAIENQRITCEYQGRGGYGRFLGRCNRGGVDINALMVKEGWAVAYRRYDKTYVADEEYAKAQKKGLWAMEFIMPWLWRREHPRH